MNDGAIDSSSYTVSRGWIIISMTGSNDAMTLTCGVVLGPSEPGGWYFGLSV